MAERKIASESVQGLSLRQLCSDVGFTQGAFYSNFESKEALLLAVMESHQQKLLVEFSFVAQAASGGDASTVVNAVSALLKRLNHRSEWAALDMELRLHALRDRRFKTQLRRTEDRIMKAFAELISTSSRDLGLQPRLSTASIASVLFGLWYSNVLRSISDEDAELTFMLTLQALLGFDRAAT
jgi:AcrR family transcriptional regulator